MDCYVRVPLVRLVGLRGGLVRNQLVIFAKSNVWDQLQWLVNGTEVPLGRAARVEYPSHSI